jgi:hypothetical protein
MTLANTIALLLIRRFIIRVAMNTKRRALTPEEKEVSTRLRAIWDAKKDSLGLTQAKAADFFGWDSQGSVSQYLNARIPLNTDAILGFARLLSVKPSDIDPINITDAENLRAAFNEWYTLDELKERMSPSQADAFIEIPMLALFCSAGNGDSTTDDPPAFLKNLSFRRDWLAHEKLAPNDLQVCLVDGDSMEPTLYDDDVILVDTSSGSLDKLENGKVYALVYKDAPAVKRIYFQEFGKISLRSDNPNFEPEVIPEESISQLRIIGRVVWAGGKVR